MAKCNVLNGERAQASDNVGAVKLAQLEKVNAVAVKMRAEMLDINSQMWYNIESYDFE